MTRSPGWEPPWTWRVIVLIKFSLYHQLSTLNISFLHRGRRVVIMLCRAWLCSWKKSSLGSPNDDSFQEHPIALLTYYKSWDQGGRGWGSRRRRVSCPRYVFFLFLFNIILMYFYCIYLLQRQRQRQRTTRVGIREVHVLHVFFLEWKMFFKAINLGAIVVGGWTNLMSFTTAPLNTCLMRK